MTTATAALTEIDPAQLREQMVDGLIADGYVHSDLVAGALRRVPREAFMPDGVDLATAYDAHQSPIAKRDEAGAPISSVSASWLQARMIEQAGIRPGMRVLELGSGGYQAAVMAEVVGPRGRVVSVDIDGEITDRASRALDATGYGRVRVVQADGHHRIPGETGTFDALVVSFAAWDIAPSWLDQLASHGVLVVPLVMGGVTRSIAWRRDGDRLTSLSAEVCGFVSAQGAGRHTGTDLPLDDEGGMPAILRFDGAVPDGVHLAADVLAGSPVEVWSAQTVGNQISWADMHLWFACHMPGFCRVTAGEASRLRTPGAFFFPQGNVYRDSLAMFIIRRLDDGGAEWGAAGYGPHGEQAARDMVGHIQRWSRIAGLSYTPSFDYLPHPHEPHPQPGTSMLPKHHGTVLIHWPTDADAAGAH